MGESTGLPQAVEDAITAVEHPEIGNTLVELGMLQGIKLSEEGDNVELILTLPMLNIPETVRDYMVQSVYQAVNAHGYGLKVKLAEMTEAQRQHFFALAQQNWKMG